ALGLVDGDNLACRLDALDGLATGELVAFLVDDVACLLLFGASKILAESVDVDDQNLKYVVHRKLAQAIDLRRVVDEGFKGHVVIERTEVLTGDLDILQHTLANGHTGHHDDELLEPIAT